MMDPRRGHVTSPENIRGRAFFGERPPSARLCTEGETELRSLLFFGCVACAVRVGSRHGKTFRRYRIGNPLRHGVVNRARVLTRDGTYAAHRRRSPRAN